MTSQVSTAMLRVEGAMAKRFSESTLVSPCMRQLVETVRSEVETRLGPQATFEQRREAAAALMAEAMEKAVDNGGDEDHGEGRQPTAGVSPCTATRKMRK